MSPDRSAALCGMYSAGAIAALQAAYAATLTYGLVTLRSPSEPIADPMFTTLEILILLMCPCIVLLLAAIHTQARCALSIAALVFGALLAGTTSVVHFAILTVGRHPAFVSQPWLLSFRWPSVAYALDILAWDIFFPLSMLCAAPAFGGVLRGLMIASAVLSLAGLAGVPTGNMEIRNIGIVGYLFVFFAVVVLLNRWFRGLLRTSSP